MKHIKKRFLISGSKETLEAKRDDFQIIKIDTDFDHKTLSNRKGSIAYIVTDAPTENVIGGFIHKVNGKNYIFPVPDPTLIYFHSAQINIQRIKEFKTTLLVKLDFNESADESGLNEMYNFFGYTSGFVIFLFTSIESFINQLIPDDYVFEKVTTRKTEQYNKSQIQENIDFKTKVVEVLPDITKKNFFKNQTPTNQMIWNLKEFRDSIVHTKHETNVLRYDNLIKKSLAFEYDKTLEAVTKFMNFYTPDYIVECGCGVNF